MIKEFDVKACPQKWDATITLPTPRPEMIEDLRHRVTVRFPHNIEQVMQILLDIDETEIYTLLNSETDLNNKITEIGSMFQAHDPETVETQQGAEGSLPSTQEAKQEKEEATPPPEQDHPAPFTPPVKDEGAEEECSSSDSGPDDDPGAAKQVRRQIQAMRQQIKKLPNQSKLNSTESTSVLRIHNGQN